MSKQTCERKCGWCPICRYLEEREKQHPSWSKEVSYDGWHWHWTGEMDSRPEIVNIQWSGSRGVYFASVGQLGWTEPQDVTDMGGWWRRVPHPRQEELRKLLEAECAESGS